MEMISVVAQCSRSPFVLLIYHVPASSLPSTGISNDNRDFHCLSDVMVQQWVPYVVIPPSHHAVDWDVSVIVDVRERSTAISGEVGNWCFDIGNTPKYQCLVETKPLSNTCKCIKCFHKLRGLLELEFCVW